MVSLAPRRVGGRSREAQEQADAEPGVPELRPVEPGRRAFGRGWLGVERHGAYRVTGTTEASLLPAWLALLLLLAAATTAWWREGRG